MTRAAALGDRGLLCEAGLLCALGLSLVSCASSTHAGTAGESGVARFNRPPGMPIGTGASGGQLDDPEAVLALDEPATNAAPPGTDVASSGGASRAVAPTPPVPCSGCVELRVDVNDINQRDEFVFAAGGAPITRVVWTVRVNFNSDQLAVQPFVDGKYGPYTNLHVNTFPLGAPVQVVQEHAGKAQHIGLAVGSSGAWTGNQTMSVFIDSVSVEGPRGFTQSFETGSEGLEPRTHANNPQHVFNAAEITK